MRRATEHLSVRELIPGHPARPSPARSIERDLVLVATAAGAAFCGLCWWLGLYPREGLPPARSAEESAAVEEALTELEYHTATLAGLLADIRGPRTTRRHHLTGGR